jgi:histidinol-phosphate aminotransferase
VKNGKAVYDYLLGKGIVVRDRSRVELCEGCLRITVGTADENEQLVSAIGNYEV